MILPNQKSLFNIPDHVTYLNCANMSPLLKRVSLAGKNAINRRKSPWDIQSQDWFDPAEQLRSLFAKIISASQDNIALIPSVSYGIAIAAKNLSLKSGEKIVVLDQQYPSNVYVWDQKAKRNNAKIVTVKRRADETWTQSLLRTINERTAIISIPNCHWTDGSFIDLEAVSQKAKEVGSKLVIDASQSLGAYPLDIKKIKPDFLVTVGYKWLLGPYHLGYLYADSDYCREGEPLEHSWLTRFGSEDFNKLVDYTDVYRIGARRFDGGEFPSFIQIPMAIEALSQVLEWGVNNIQTTTSHITDKIEKLAKKSGFDVIKRKQRVGHMIGIQMPEDLIALVKPRLIESDIYVSFRGSRMRLAPYLYNDISHVRRLFEKIV